MYNAIWTAHYKDAVSNESTSRVDRSSGISNACRNPFARYRWTLRNHSSRVWTRGRYDSAIRVEYGLRRESGRRLSGLHGECWGGCWRRCALNPSNNSLHSSISCCSCWSRFIEDRFVWGWHNVKSMHALNDWGVNGGDLSEEESFWKSDLFGLVSGQHVSMMRGVRIICTHTQPLKMYIYEMSTYPTFPDLFQTFPHCWRFV